MSPTLGRSVAAEFLGTAVLVFVAVGSAVAGIKTIGEFGVAFAFGLTLLALAYAIGPVSGCHINPAVTLGVLLSRGMTTTEAAYFWIAQFAGGIAGAALLRLLTSGFGDMTDQTGVLGANDYGATISLGGALVLEVLLTFVFVAVILLVTGKAAAPGFAGLAGPVRRRRAARPRLAVHRGAAHRWRARGGRRAGDLRPARARRGGGGHRRRDRGPGAPGGAARDDPATGDRA
jgi:glycerol uptake facilitator-like aquaporin